MNDYDNYKVANQEYSQFPYVQAQTIMPNDKADLLDKIKPDLIVEFIRHRLMGEELINGQWIPNRHLKDKALTFRGAWDIANLMLGVSSQNVSLSKLADIEIKRRTLSIIKTAMYMCARNREEYGIKTIDQYYFVYEIIMSNTFITLKQPEGEGIRKLLAGTYAEQKVTTEAPTKTGGIFSGLFRR